MDRRKEGEDARNSKHHLQDEEYKKEEISEREEWIYTYGDMVTLLMCFFVIMFSSTKEEQEKLKAISLSFKGGPPASPYVLQGGPSIFEELEINMKTSKLLDEISLNVDDRGLSIQLGDTMMFNPNSAVLSSDSKSIISKFSLLVQSISNSIVIEGHANKDFKGNQIYASDWDLSAVRASRVAEELVRNGIERSRIEIAAYGSTRPRVIDTTPEGSRLNNRVEILLRPEDD